ncbi:hypothetical protein BMR05_14050 [Methylococcaceae bacterium HT4]|nr:hypothetical protein BMR11_16985 [Methylococcaceae bacterium CS5]TXK93726.1 hypothetical protein BMR10_15110 [Methylococcaceae bacterium CS4]TXL02354.1 hypothetical protein BMR09_17050 [Methylococcaceae bacterium CS3]TXL03589.1 hypothetical protein BMR07_14815 [Methylococcaceae bacterium CS1]TXL06995.1 hypothetical protein BMR08_15110 [Methylococcaceae bacterium CS2]TXL12845.1 hypothetical protein BMR05_14050 [Methylococcaceae bacterium HT4]TXL13983.1 hypothetical protein BMR04_13830 [Meth
MINFFIKIATLFFMLSFISKASEPIYSPSTQDLEIPSVIVGNDLYTVKMKLITDDPLIFRVIELTKRPSFEQRFESISENMSKQQVIDLLGVPDHIYAEEMETRVYCDEPPLELGSRYEQWNYGVEQIQEPSGYAVWFFRVPGQHELRVVGKIEGFGCM